MSIFDWVASLMGAAIVGYLLGIHEPITWVLFVLGWIGFGVVTHYVLGVDTMLGYYMGLNPRPIRRHIC